MYRGAESRFLPSSYTYHLFTWVPGIPSPQTPVLLTPSSLPPSIHFWSTLSPIAPRSPAKLSFQVGFSPSMLERVRVTSMVVIHDLSLFLSPVSVQWQRTGAHPFHQRGWPLDPRGALPRAPEAMTTTTTPFLESLHPCSWTLQLAISRRKTSTDRLMLWSWWGGYSWERENLSLTSTQNRQLLSFLPASQWPPLHVSYLNGRGGLFIYFLKATGKNLA